jgi:Zn-dependent peptidase ImmA (M78 family)
MEIMAIARINGKIISWALRRSGASLESLATKKISLEKLSLWEKGEEFPSEGDAEALAVRLGIAYPMLFMENVPPEEPLAIPDRRTVDGRPLTNPSLALLDVLDSTRARQNWYRAEMEALGYSPLAYVAKFPADAAPSVVATDMRTTFNLDSAAMHEARDYEGFLKALVSKAENLGILVMRSAVVGHASRRTLQVKEFRGFALLDPFAPIVFINDTDAKAAQIFTFAHEVAHIWIGASGVSDRTPNEKGSSSNIVETRCDAIAAEFLAPEKEILSFWKPSQPLDRNMFAAGRHFNVSSLVILRRAKDLNLISSGEFFAKVDEQYEAYRRKEREDREKLARASSKKKKGGNFWNSFEIRNGHKFNATVVNAVRSRRATYAEAGSLFGINPGAAARYLQKLGAR